MDKYPQIIPITHSYLEDCCLFIKGNTPSHTGKLNNRVIKPIFTEGVLCIVENICLKELAITEKKGKNGTAAYPVTVY